MLFILAAMMKFVAFGQCFIGTCAWLLGGPRGVSPAAVVRPP
jgi:hypothetical protein